MLKTQICVTRPQCVKEIEHLGDVVLCRRMVFKFDFKIRKLMARKWLNIRSLGGRGILKPDTESRSP